MARPVKAEKIKKPMRKAAVAAVVSISLAAGGLGGYLARNPEKVGWGTGRAKPTEIFASKKPGPEPAVEKKPQKETGEKKKEVLLERTSVPWKNKDVEGEGKKAQEIDKEKEELTKETQKKNANVLRKKRRKSISDEKLIAWMTDPMVEKQPETSCADVAESIAVMRALNAGHGDKVKKYFEKKKAREGRAEKRENAREEMARMRKRAEKNRLSVEPQGPASKRPEVKPHMEEPHIPVDREKYRHYRNRDRCADSEIECSPF
ncbi:MAG: hypothetical protein ACLFUZ_02745 [Candidatus Micrarchaeia archaeon]